MYSKLKQDIPILVIMFVIRLITANNNLISIWPDEHVQLLEPAYNDVFGQGVLAWEWNKNYPIRTPFLIQFVIFFYWLLKVTHLDYSFLVAYGVRYFIALPFCVVFDYHLILIIRLLFPAHKNSYLITLVVMVINLSNEFSARFMTRTFYNTFECFFNAITIYWWLKSGLCFIKSKPNRSLFWEIMCRMFTTFNFMIRSACVIIWPIPYIMRIVFKGLYHHKVSDNSTLNVLVSKKYTSILCQYAINSIHLKLSILIPFIFDIFYFKTFNYTIFNFVKWNIIDGNCKQFGVAPFSFFMDATYPAFFNEQLTLLKIGLVMVIVIAVIGMIRLVYQAKSIDLQQDSQQQKVVLDTQNVQNTNENKTIKQKGTKMQTNDEKQETMIVDDQQKRKEDIKAKQKTLFTWFQSVAAFEIVIMFVLYNLSQFASPHKEDRFILGIYPLMVVFLVYPLLTLALRLRLPLTTIMMLYPLVHRNMNIHYRDNKWKRPSQYLVADEVRMYNENVRPIQSFYDFHGRYEMYYNSHLHIRNGKYMNQQNTPFNKNNKKDLENFLNQHVPSHLFMHSKYYQQFKMIFSKAGYKVVKELKWITDGREEPQNLRYLLENVHAYDY